MGRKVQQKKQQKKVKQFEDFDAPKKGKFRRQIDEPFAPKRGTSQAEAMAKVQGNDLTFLLGPAGTAKTHIAVRAAVERLWERKIKKIVLVRPMVDADSEMGFLPGTKEEKVIEWLMPMLAIVDKLVGKHQRETWVKAGILQLEALTFMRGSTIEDADAIMDEGQNATDKQMKLFLTRAGENCRVTVTMDPDQCDLNEKKKLDSAANFLYRFKNKPHIALHVFDESECVRSRLARTVLSCY